MFIFSSGGRAALLIPGRQVRPPRAVNKGSVGRCDHVLAFVAETGILGCSQSPRRHRHWSLCLPWCLTAASCFPFPEPAQPRSVFPADSSGKIRLSQTPGALHPSAASTSPVLAAGADFQDIEVHLRRQKSGFGFRVLGGDEAGQPVSPETREKARMAMGVETCHFFLSNPPHTV